MAFGRKAKTTDDGPRTTEAPRRDIPPNPPAAVVKITNELKRQLDRGENVLALIERIGRYEHATISELKNVFAELRKLT